MPAAVAFAVKLRQHPAWFDQLCEQADSTIAAMVTLMTSSRRPERSFAGVKVVVTTRNW